MDRRERLLATTTTLFLSVVSCSFLACGGAKIPVFSDSSGTHPGIRPAVGAVPATSEVIEEAEAMMNRAAKASRAKARVLSFEDWERGVTRDPDGKYIVNGDVAISDRKQLREFFENSVKKDAASTRVAGLIVHTVGGDQALWNSSDKINLSYCVSSGFGSRHQTVVDAMSSATGAWEAVADLKFVYLPAHDNQCTASNSNVLFDIRPVSVNGAYLARAFFPNEPRPARNVLIDESSFQLGGGSLSLVGILRHELGHALGFRHEHTRPESGACFEDNDWVPVTDYDRFSVMHYPQCNGGGDWSLTLTDKDKNGAACVYGPAPGFSIDSAFCTPKQSPAAVCESVSDTFENQSVSAGQEKSFGPFAVLAGTIFNAEITGAGFNPGDPDLYVRFGAAPERQNGKYSCRPYLSGADENCALDVPAGETQAFVMVHGYAAGNFHLSVDYTASGQP